MSDQELVQVGCMRCKRSRAKHVRKTLDELMGPAFDQLQKMALKEGIVVPDALHEKMRKFCRKNGLLPEEEPVPDEPAAPSIDQ